MGIPLKLKLKMVRLRDRLPLGLQRYLNRLAFRWLLPAEERRLWDRRLQQVLSCGDNAHLPRHEDAGKVRDGVMTMHNGLLLHAGSYYGWGSQRILERNRGCHEPQEERAFAEVLRHVAPGSSMVELGAYWSFYSLWFATTVESAKNWMVEPEAGNLDKGQANFSLNGKVGMFVQGYVGAEHAPEGNPAIISVDGLMRQHGIKRLAVLHSDIQGFEGQMLDGAQQALETRRVDYLFISTHSNELHGECCAKLKAAGYLIWQDIDLDASFAHDGLIVAQNPDLPLLPTMDLDRRSSN
jgi:hypothetical protein